MGILEYEVIQSVSLLLQRACVDISERIAALAQQLDEHDPSSWLGPLFFPDSRHADCVEAVTTAAPSPIRPTNLLVRSDLIKHLSTAKVFSWATAHGAGVMGQLRSAQKLTADPGRHRMAK